MYYCRQSVDDMTDSTTVADGVVWLPLLSEVMYTYLKGVENMLPLKQLKKMLSLTIWQNGKMHLLNYDTFTGGG